MSSVTDAKSSEVDAIVVINNESKSKSLGLIKDCSPNQKVLDTPRIITNELLIKPQTSPGPDRLDELCSLEREIAKMHHVEEEPNENVDDSAVGNYLSSKFYTDQNEITVNSATYKNSKNEAMLKVQKDVNTDPIESGATSFEHEDLIAVLKGLDDSFTADDALTEGVTIEGEGKYQIMEVVDDECTSIEEKTTSSVLLGKSISPPKTFGAVLCTSESERALALEQMEGLKNKSRRRKQDIKPIKQSDAVMDLVSALEAEWTDTDEEPKEAASIKLVAEKNVIKSELTKKRDLKSPLVTSVVVIPSPKQSISPVVTSDETKTTETTPTLTTSPNAGTKQTPAANSLPDGITETKTEESQMVPTSTGFRRARVIKRKIIWDPDAPETTFSYANLVTSSKSKTKPEAGKISTPTTKKVNTTKGQVKKDATPNHQKKSQRPVTPKDKKLNPDTNTSLEKKANTIKNELDNKVSPKAIEQPCSPVTVSAATRKRPQTPVTNGPGSAKKKKVSELDRLMGDEGAVNMINSLEKLGSILASSDNKPSRPMMRSRAATICDKSAIRNCSPSPAKTPPPASNIQVNIKGKRTGKQRPSSSWDFVYQQKQKNIDDSMIIRRRSNSSYSSNASVNRLSIDAPTTALNVSAANISKLNDSRKEAQPEDTSIMSESTSTINDSKSAGASTKSISTPISGGKSFEFAKPETKKAQKRTKTPGGTFANDIPKPSAPVNIRADRSVPNLSDEESEISPSSKSPTNGNSTAKEKAPTPEVVVRKLGNVTKIIFSTNKAKISYTFTSQMMNKLVHILEKLATDPDTHVIVIVTNDTNFCQGVDLAELVAVESAEKRQNAVKNLVTALKKYLKALATFPKPLILGANGHVMNLGVMQLVLFDVVVAGDKCTYETPYVRMGQVPEGYSLWSSSNKIRGSLKTKLLWLSEKVDSPEAAIAGLVNKVIASNKVNEEAVLIAKKIAALPPEAYRVMKKTSSSSHREVLETLFEEEFNTIAEQWSSPEFMGHIKNYVDQGHF